MEKKSLIQALEELQTCFERKYLNEVEYAAAKAKILESFTSFATPSPIPVHHRPLVVSTPQNAPHDVDFHLKEGHKADSEGTDEEDKVELNLKRMETFQTFLEATPLSSAGTMVENRSFTEEDNSTDEEERAGLELSFTETKEKDGLNITTAAERNVKTNHSISFAIKEATVSQFWSLVLQTPIPEGEFYPRPENAREVVRLPFLIHKSLIDTLIDDSKEHGMKSGAGLALKAYHKEVFEGLQIPWCV